MNTLTSALNYGALIALSCCNAALQIAAAPACSDSGPDSGWPSCAADGAVGGDELRSRLFKPGQVTRLVLAERPMPGTAHGVDGLVAQFHDDGRLEGVRGDRNVGQQWQLQGDRLCLKFDPSYLSQPECGWFEVARGKLFLVEGEGLRRAVDGIDWVAH